LAGDVGFVLFGLTGGFASGKSSVAAHWRGRGLHVIDADDIAREVLAKRSAGLTEVVQAFGEGVLQPDGSLDRKKLASVVFGNDEARRKLESITHPRIVAATLQRASDLEAQHELIACYEASLLVERGLADLFRPLVVVAADERHQVARARARDKLSEDEARARLKAQLPLKDKLAAADYVIRNDGDLVSLVTAADDVLDAICKKAGVDPARFPRLMTRRRR
jgi:dephospho-CoA kinase